MFKCGCKGEFYHEASDTSPFVSIKNSMRTTGVATRAIPFDSIYESLQQKGGKKKCVIKDMDTLRSCVQRMVIDANRITKQSNKKINKNYSDADMERKGWNYLIESVKIEVSSKGKVKLETKSAYGGRTRLMVPVNGRSKDTKQLQMWVQELTVQLQGEGFQAVEINIIWSRPGASHQGIHPEPHETVTPTRFLTTL